MEHALSGRRRADGTAAVHPAGPLTHTVRLAVRGVVQPVAGPADGRPTGERRRGARPMTYRLQARFRTTGVPDACPHRPPSAWPPVSGRAARACGRPARGHRSGDGGSLRLSPLPVEHRVHELVGPFALDQLVLHAGVPPAASRGAPSPLPTRVASIAASRDPMQPERLEAHLEQCPGRLCRVPLALVVGMEHVADLPLPVVVAQPLQDHIPDEPILRRAARPRGSGGRPAPGWSVPPPSGRAPCGSPQVAWLGVEVAGHIGQPIEGVERIQVVGSEWPQQQPFGPDDGFDDQHRGA